MNPPFDTNANVFRRRITVRSLERGRVRCELHDDYHHFIVTITHDDTQVVDLEVESLRWPWTTCPSASVPLRSLIGAPISDRFTSASSFANASLNCTHQFDCAAYAITHAHGRVHGTRDRVRRYDVEIGASMATATHGPGRNRFWSDGTLKLEWRVLIGTGPVELAPPFNEAPWKGGFMRWADAMLEPDAAEHAITLRRASDIGMGRGMDLDAIAQASELSRIMAGVCYTMQPTIAIGALRNRGNDRDYANDPERVRETFNL